MRVDKEMYEMLNDLSEAIEGSFAITHEAIIVMGEKQWTEDELEDYAMKISKGKRGYELEIDTYGLKGEKIDGYVLEILCCLIRKMNEA